MAGARGRAAAWSLSSQQLWARWPLRWVLGVFRKLLQGSEVGQRTCWRTGGHGLGGGCAQAWLVATGAATAGIYLTFWDDVLGGHFIVSIA